MVKFRIILPMLFLTFSVVVWPTAAQILEEDRGSYLDQQSPAARFAIESAEIAGGATYCEIEPDDVETYINQAHAEMAALAADEVDLVVSRIVFSNIYTHTIARGPDQGCDAYGLYFLAQANRITR